MLRVDERRDSARLLRIRNDVQREGRLAGRFLPVALDDPAARQSADAERHVERHGTRRDDGDLLNLLVAETHDRHLAEFLADLAHHRVERGIAGLLLSLLLSHDQFSTCGGTIFVPSAPSARQNQAPPDVMTFVAQTAQSSLTTCSQSPVSVKPFARSSVEIRR